MRATLSLRLAAVSAHAPLLPPIPLYRRILRAHRKHLDPEMRVIGDKYIGNEFRAHRDIDNPIHIIGFLAGWNTYARQVEDESWQGAQLEQEKFDKMSDEQIVQLYDLMKAIQDRNNKDGGDKDGGEKS